MVLSLPSPLEGFRAQRRYLRPPQPLHFPEEESLPDGDEHFERRVILYQSVRYALGEQGLVSSDQFLYWDPTDPGKRLSPDLGVRVGVPRERIRSWKIWERGAPHVGVEMVSESDASERVFAEKLARYRQAGVLEVVRFDPERTPTLRLWDLVDGDLVERDPSDPEALRCDALGCYWCVRDEPGLSGVLRLSRKPGGVDVLPTPAEAESSRADGERAAKEAALARVAELEMTLKGR